MGKANATLNVEMDRQIFLPISGMAGVFYASQQLLHFL